MLPGRAEPTVGERYGRGFEKPLVAVVTDDPASAVMDYDARRGIEQAIPQRPPRPGGRRVGSAARRREPPENPSLLNHVGSQHAGGLFSAGEAASGGAFVGAFAEEMGEITPLAAAAEIEYQ